MAAAPQIACLLRPASAAALLQPLRLRILAALRQPDSAAGIARRLRLPRQRVNYHVRELARNGLLRRAGQRRQRGMIERRYVATARAYIIAPQVLGALAADRARVEDTFSAAYLLAMTAQVQRDLSRVLELAAAQEKRLATLSISTKLRFEDAAQRADFTRALRQAIVHVVTRHASPERAADGGKGAGRPFRLVVGCYPAPPEEPDADGVHLAARNTDSGQEP